MLAALLANIRIASYPIQAGRGKRSVWWLDQYPKELVDEKKRIAKDLKLAGERLRFMRVEGEAKKRFDKLAAEYTVNGKVDYLEMAFSGDIRHEVDSLLIVADDEEFFLWFT